MMKRNLTYTVTITSTSFYLSQVSKNTPLLTLDTIHNDPPLSPSSFFLLYSYPNLFDLSTLRVIKKDLKSTPSLLN